MHIPGVDYTESFAPVASDSGIRIVIGIFLYYLHQDPQDNWVLESFDVEVAFLNELLSHPVYKEWPKVIKEFAFLSQEECSTSCAELTRAVYGNIDSPLQWMKTFSNILKGDTMKMQQRDTDPCIFYK
jgi:Reverse transcriptase (RNA-dependent DNA polymerase)